MSAKYKLGVATRVLNYRLYPHQKFPCSNISKLLHDFIVLVVIKSN